MTSQRALPESIAAIPALSVAPAHVRYIKRGIVTLSQDEARHARWRQAENGRTLSLVIMRAGRDALGIEEEPDEAPMRIAAVDPEPEAVHQDQPVSNQPRSGTKQALLVSILSGRSGASLNELMAATGWLAHTTRAALTRLRQRGYVLERLQQADQPTSWRIVATHSSTCTGSSCWFRAALMHWEATIATC